MKFIYISIICLLSISCASEKDFFERTPYGYEKGQKNLYVVDTIKISNPLIITTKNNHCFVCSEEVFNNYNGKESFFFNNPYVYIYQDYLPVSMPSEVFSHALTGGFSIEIQENKKKKGIDSIYKFLGEPPVYFLLVLIQGDYYNSEFTGFHVPAGYYLGYETFSYYRVALPLDLSFSSYK